MSYRIYNEKGILIAEVDNNFAHKIINSVPGFFRNMKVKSDVEKTVFEITDDMKFAFLGFKLFLWKGYVLIPE
jgi:hypothetical protein